jgi:hypothetical protein
MKRFSLFRRRQVWLPTLWGWLVLLAVIGVVCVLAGRHIYALLAPNDPAPRARILVVEGWMSDKELDQAVAVFRRGKYERIVTTGGPIESWVEFYRSSTYAELAASYLKKHGLDSVDVTAVSAPASAQDRTFLSAVKVRDWAARQGLMLEALDVFSAGAHGQRSRRLYRMAFGPKVDVGVLSARPLDYDERHWWRTSVGAKSVVTETIGLLWTICCFHPPPPGSHEEMWGAPLPAERH